MFHSSGIAKNVLPKLLLLQHKFLLKPARKTLKMGSVEMAKRSRPFPLLVVEFLLLCMIIRFIGGLTKTYFVFHILKAIMGTEALMCLWDLWLINFSYVSELCILFPALCCEQQLCVGSPFIFSG